MIVLKKYLGRLETSDSIRKLLGNGDLMPIDSWSEVGLMYEKYNNEDLKRNWDKIVKAPDGMQNLDKAPTEGSWGILYEG